MLGVHDVRRDRADYYLSDLAHELPVLVFRVGGRERRSPLSGSVGPLQPAAFRLLLEGRHPCSGRPMGSGRVAVAALDLTFSAPKSVSVLFALGGDETARAVVSAHTEAVAGALCYLEHYGIAAVRRSGPERTVVATTGMIAGHFTHAVNRNGDPHLHSHVVMANLVHGVDGRWSACDGRGVGRPSACGGHRVRGTPAGGRVVPPGRALDGRPRTAGRDRRRRPRADRRVLVAGGGHSSPHPRGRCALAPGPPGRVGGHAPRQGATGLRIASSPRSGQRRAHVIGGWRGTDRLATGRHRTSAVRRAPIRRGTLAHAARRGPPPRRGGRIRLGRNGRHRGVLPRSDRRPVGACRLGRGGGAAAPAPDGRARPRTTCARSGPDRSIRLTTRSWVDAAAAIDAYRARWGIARSPEPLGTGRSPAGLASLPAGRLADHLRITRQLEVARTRLGRREAAAVELGLGR